MLYCEKSGSFDRGLIHPAHCNPPPLLTKPTRLTLLLNQSNHFIHPTHSPHSVHPVCSIHHTLSLYSFICRNNIFDPDQSSFDKIQHIATCLNMYEQGDQMITTFSTRQMLHVVLRKVGLV